VPDQHQLVGSHSSGLGMQRGLRLAEIPVDAPTSGRACALAFPRPAPAHFLTQIFPVAGGRPPPARCAHAPHANTAASGGRGKIALGSQCACGARSRLRVRPGSHGAHVSTEGGTTGAHVLPCVLELWVAPFTADVLEPLGMLNGPSL
jgi:hypothetical protein